MLRKLFTAKIIFPVQEVAASKDVVHSICSTLKPFAFKKMEPPEESENTQDSTSHRMNFKKHIIKIIHGFLRVRSAFIALRHADQYMAAAVTSASTYFDSSAILETGSENLSVLVRRESFIFFLEQRLPCETT